MVIFAGIMEYLSKERHDRIVAELKQLIDEAMYSHSLLLAAVAAALLLPACSRRDAARIDDGASARVEVLRSELKEGLATQDEMPSTAWPSFMRGPAITVRRWTATSTIMRRPTAFSA